MYPLLAAWNCTPKVTALVSAASTEPVGVPPCQILHGHWATAPVVKPHENGPLIGVPEAFCAPATVAVYVVLPDSGLDGVNVATVSALLKLTVPLTMLFDESFTVNDTVPGCTGWENVADGATDTAAPVAPRPAIPSTPPAGYCPPTASRPRRPSSCCCCKNWPGRCWTTRRRRPRRWPARSAAHSSPPKPAPG